MPPNLLNYPMWLSFLITHHRYVYLGILLIVVGFFLSPLIIGIPILILGFLVGSFGIWIGLFKKILSFIPDGEARWHSFLVYIKDSYKPYFHPLKK